MDLRLRIEAAIREAVDYAGAVSDLSQAFDRPLREIIVPMAVVAGFPEPFCWPGSAPSMRYESLPRLRLAMRLRAAWTRV